MSSHPGVPNDKECSNCTDISQYYCNPCHMQLCEKCKENHLKSLDFLHHEILSIHQQQPVTFPTENCNVHPSNVVISCCDTCLIPLCFRCAANPEHKGHEFVSLKTIYAEKFDLCSERISRIKEHLLPISNAQQSKTTTDLGKVKEIITNIKTSIIEKASEIKQIVNTTVLQNMEQLDKIEQNLLHDVETQGNAIDAYVLYLNGFVEKYEAHVSSKKLTEFISLYKETMNIRDVPEAANPQLPEYIPGHADKTEIANLLGSIIIPGNDNPKMSKKKTAERKASFDGMSSPKQGKHTENDFKLSRSNEVMYRCTLNKRINVSNIENVLHISLENANQMWVSDLWGSLVQIDTEGNVLKTIKANYGERGFHTVTKNGDLLYTDQQLKVINMVHDGETIQFTSTGSWTPLSIHFSRINGEILVGMMKGNQGKIIRYSEEGTKIHSIHKTYLHQSLYERPNYLTESVNGDICTSDSAKEAVIVVNKAGKFRFNYKGQKPKFIPYGICTDIHRHIMVCDGHCKDVHLLDQDGQFLFLILNQQEHCPQGLCVDDNYSLFVGQGSINEVTVYQYNR